jgi:hypothetical protein
MSCVVLERQEPDRLRARIRRHQEFSNLMLSLFNGGAAPGGHRDGTGSSYGLRRARLDQIVGDPLSSRWFAHAYVGVDWAWCRASLRSRRWASAGENAAASTSTVE